VLWDLRIQPLFANCMPCSPGSPGCRGLDLKFTPVSRCFWHPWGSPNSCHLSWAEPHGGPEGWPFKPCKAAYSDI
jgi:hypothetical protein